MLSATIEHHLDETNTATAKQIKDDIYVDNVVMGTNNDEEAFQLYKEAKKNFQDASINLRDWISNSKFVNENTSPDHQMKERVTKVLGLIWNTNTDEFSISTKKLKSIEQAKIKREVLATLASIFDPLGMITPVTLKMKLFPRELWENEKEWDKRLSSEEITTWKGVMVELNGSLQYIYQDMWEMDPVSYCVVVICQAKHMQPSSTYAQ